jgi:hypothetical protein
LGWKKSVFITDIDVRDIFIEGICRYDAIQQQTHQLTFVRWVIPVEREREKNK